MMKPVITVKNLSKKFPQEGGHRRTEAFYDLNLTIHEGEFLVLLGPSGCGKSTLLRIISGLDQATSGTVKYEDNFNLEKVGFVFQNFGILPWLSVSQNIELGLLGSNLKKEELEKQLKDILVKFGLHEASDRFPNELSGGMKQRVGLARAFIIKPSIIFLDEPFSELDFFTARTLRNLLLEMWQEQKMTVVMVSHYIEDAVALADRIAIFSDKPSTIKTVLNNHLTRPRNFREESFFKLEDEIMEHFKQ